MSQYATAIGHLALAGAPRTSCSDREPDASAMSFLYGGAGATPVRTAADGTRFVHLRPGAAPVRDPPLG
jgi:hypothetical protein